ncbi:MAG: murein transglycosylase A [Rhodospirillales bacterium]
MKAFLLPSLLLLALAACEGKKKEPATRDSRPSGPAVALPPPPVIPAEGAVSLTKLDFALLPGWQEDDPSEAIVAFRRSCTIVDRRPPAATIGPGGRFGRVIDWRPACAALGEPGAYDAQSARAYFETWFEPYLLAADGRSEGLFTGYYEAEVEGALSPGGAYRWPLYGPPNAAILARAPDRAAIEDGALDGRGLEIAWLNDPVDSFNLHIQGSAVMTLPDGSQQRIGYAATNGLTFVGIGRLMLQRGLIGPDQASAQGVRDWLKANPEEARELMRENPRYVFFRWIEAGGDGPIGAQGIPLTAGRSLAVDPAYLAYGLPLFLETTYATGQPLRRLMIAQDTGGAIKGPVRGDLFWGSGEPALDLAGGMKQRGRYYLFLPRTLTVQARAG